MPAATLRGRFVWHELMTTDPDGAARFYPGVTGWKVQAWEQDPSYRLWMAGGIPMGGLMRLPEESRRLGAPPSWLMYVGVPDVDATVRQAASLGARTLVPPQTIPVGRFAVLEDPQGATFALYKPSGERPGSDEATLGDFSWHELATTDPGAAWGFYAALFGWNKTEAMDMGPLGVYQMFGRAGKQSLGGVYRKPLEMAGASHWLCYIKVPNADKAAETVKRLGGRVMSGPMDVPGGGRIATCVDLQGATFAVHSVAPARAKSPSRPKPKKAKKAAKRVKKARPRAAAKRRRKRR